MLFRSVDYDLDGDNDLIVGCSDHNFSDPDSIVIMFNDGWGNLDMLGFEANSGIFIYCEDLTGDGYPDIISRDADSIFFYENDQNGGIGNQYMICHAIGNRRIAGIYDMDLNGYLDIVYYGIFLIRGWGIAYNLDGYNFYDDYKYYSEDNEYVTAGFIDEDSLADVFVTDRLVPLGASIMFNKLTTFDKEKISERHWGTTYIFDANNDSENDPITTVNSAYYEVKSWMYFFQKDEEDDYILYDSTDLHGGSWIETIQDFDQDGYPDLALTVNSWTHHTAEDSIFVYRNDQNWGYYLYHQHYIGDWFYPVVQSGDLNMDGYPEMISIGFLNPDADHIQLLWNDGTGHFIDTNSVYVSIPDEVTNPEIQVIVFPNPATDRLKIKANNEPIEEVVFYSLQGELFFRNRIKTALTELNLNLNEMGFKPGIYICKIIYKNNKSTNHKIIINQTN